MSWIISGLINCPILSPVFDDTPNSKAMALPKIGGMVNAEAIAMISLTKNNPYDTTGKARPVLVPYLTAYSLSFFKLSVVFTRKTIANF